jgi:rhamnosyltransferase
MTVITPPTIDSICVVIITFNPTQHVNKLIQSLPVAIKKIIVDNNSQNESAEIVNKLAFHENVILIRNAENEGIAKALNQGIEIANEKQYEWVLAFDQDSLPTENIFDILIRTYHNYQKRNLLALIGVNFSANFSKSVNDKIKKGEKEIEAETIITSGSMLSLAVFRELGPYCEDFFIDCVDLEYCLRLRSRGYKVVISSEVGLIHECGTISTKKILFLKFSSSCHNAFRRYYMARNNMVISKLYFFKFPLWVIKKNYFLLKSILIMLVVDDNKVKKIQKTFQGIFHGLFYKSLKARS